MAFNRTDNTSTLTHATAPAATDQIHLFDKLMQMVETNQSLQTAAVFAGGTSGYTVGDILRIADGPGDASSTEAFPSEWSGCQATLEVTAVSSGVVTAVRIRNAGLYSTLPANNGTANRYDTVVLASTGSPSGTVQITTTFDENGWTINRQTSEVASSTVDTAGTGYVNAESVTLTDSGSEQVAATATIAVTAGAITGFTITDGGEYHKLPSTLTVTGGSGSGGIAAPTYTALTGDAAHREAILTGDSGVVVGIRTFSVTASVAGNADNWELASMPAYTAANDFGAQVQISPGRWDAGDTGHYYVLRDVGPSTFDFFMEVNSRYISITAEIDTAVYTPMLLGFGNQYAAASDYAFPALILGCSSRHDHSVASNAASFLGVNAAVAESNGDTNGPSVVYSPGGSWRRVRNGRRSNNDVLGVRDSVSIIPGGQIDTDSTSIATEDKVIDDIDSVSVSAEDSEVFASVATNSGGNFGAPTDLLYPCPGSTEKPKLREIYLVGIAFENQLYVEVPGFRWVDRTISGSTLNAEDEVTDDDGSLWVIFNNCRSTERQHWFAMKVSA